MTVAAPQGVTPRTGTTRTGATQAGAMHTGGLQTVTTPPARRVIRRSLFWVAVALFALLIAIVMAGLTGNQSAGEALSGTNAAPGGARALVEVLRSQGVHVTITDTLADTRSAITDPADTTLFVFDSNGYLTGEQAGQASSLAVSTVWADPDFTALQSIAPDVAQAGAVTGTLHADCPLSAVAAAGTVSGDGTGFRVVANPDKAVPCLGSSDNVYSLVQLPSDAGTLTILGTTDALTNEHIIANGNAALALTLLGAHRDLVWYLPGLGDLPSSGADAAARTPGWVTPVILLLALTGIAAAVWRGRRFGPLVIENLPVTVRANETMLGRARLYARSSSRLRALDALRIGAIRRLAATCGLPRVASVDDVIVAVAGRTGRSMGAVRDLLLEDIPATDRDLVRLSDELAELESAVAKATTTQKQEGRE